VPRLDGAELVLVTEEELFGAVVGDTLPVLALTRPEVVLPWRGNPLFVDEISAVVGNVLDSDDPTAAVLADEPDDSPDDAIDKLLVTLD